MVKEFVSPGTVILDTQDIVARFRQSVGRYLKEADIKEIITQVIATYLNQEGDDVTGFLELPEFNRMSPNQLLSDPAAIKSIRYDTQVLVRAIGQRLKEKGMYLNNTFSYAFDQLLGNDIVLFHLPH